MQSVALFSQQQRVAGSSRQTTTTCQIGSGLLPCLLSPRVQQGQTCGVVTRVRPQQVVSAYAPSLPSPAPQASAESQPKQSPPSVMSARPSLDPMAASWEQAWEPGRLVTVKSPEQFSELLSQHADKLLVLMCKSHSCRPCKMFTRKYLSVAQRFPDCVVAEIYGDETAETRKMMMQMDVRVTPTFRLYRQGDCVSTVTGTNDKKLMRGMLAAMNAAELAAHQQEIADTMSFDEGDQQLAPANAGGNSSSSS